MWRESVRCQVAQSPDRSDTALVANGGASAPSILPESRTAYNPVLYRREIDRPRLATNQHPTDNQTQVKALSTSMCRRRASAGALSSHSRSEPVRARKQVCLREVSTTCQRDGGSGTLGGTTAWMDGICASHGRPHPCKKTRAVEIAQTVPRSCLASCPLLPQDIGKT